MMPACYCLLLPHACLPACCLLLLQLVGCINKYFRNNQMLLLPACYCLLLLQLVGCIHKYFRNNQKASSYTEALRGGMLGVKR